MAQETPPAARPSSSSRKQQGRLATDSRAFRSIQSTLQQDQRGSNARAQGPRRIAPTDNASSSARRPEPTSGSCDVSGSISELSIDEAVSMTYVQEQLTLMTTSNKGPSFSRIMSLCVKCARQIGEDIDDWRSFVDSCLLNFAIDHGHVFIDLVVDISLVLIDDDNFQEAMEFVISRHIILLLNLDWEEENVRMKIQSVCELMEKLLVANWPRNYSRCTQERNAVLYAVMNIVRGWLNALTDQIAAPDEEKTTMCDKCAQCLLYLCQIASRKLWLKWPELVDEFYAVIKSLIVSGDIVVTRGTRTLLLDLFVQINEWPKSGSQGRISTTQKQSINKTTQTDS